MLRLTGISLNDKDKLYNMLMSDSNFRYDVSEGGFYTNDHVVVGIDRSPYHCMVYAATQSGEEHVQKWHDYIVNKWNKTQNS